MAISGMWALLLLAFFHALPGYADTLSVACSSPVGSASAGQNTSLYIDCVINAPDATSNYRITPSTSNFISGSAIILSKSGGGSLTALLQTSLVSPDASVISIAGTSLGFTAQITANPNPKTIRFTYAVNVGSGAAGGLYNGTTSPTFRYRICNKTNCGQQIFTGSAPATLSLAVASAPVSVTCASPSVTALPGGGPFNLDVLCTLSGGMQSQMSPSGQNVFSPGTVTLSGGSSNVSATLQSAVTSPDSSVTNISGTAGGGFTGKINSMPAKIQVRYSGSTTNMTPAGTYTSAPITLTWSTI